MAESTTIFGSPSVTMFITERIFSGDPTEVPPNLKTFILSLFFVIPKILRKYDKNTFYE